MTELVIVGPCDERNPPMSIDRPAPPPNRPNGKPPRRYPCSKCREWFWYRDELTRHMDAIHPVAPDD